MDTYVGITKPTPMDKHHLGSTQDSQFFVHKRFVNINQNPFLEKREQKRSGGVRGGFPPSFKQDFLVGNSSSLRNPDATPLIAPQPKPNVSNLVDSRLAPPINPLAVK